MLAKLLEQISAFIKSGNFKAAIETLSSIITVLYQTSKTNLQKYPAEHITAIHDRLAILDPHFDPREMLKQYERTMGLIERYNDQSVKKLDHLEVTLKSGYGERRIRSTKLFVPEKIIPAPRFNHAKARDTQSGLTLLVEALFNAEKNQPQKLVADCKQKITDAMMKVFQKVGGYWVLQRAKLCESLRENLHISQRQGMAEFNKAFEEAKCHIENFCILKLYNEARRVLCYEVSIPNRAEEINPEIIFSTLSSINERELNLARGNDDFLKFMQLLHDSLDKLRKEGQSAVKQNQPMRDIQFCFSENYKNLIQQMLTFITDILGVPPDALCILGYGSLAFGMPRSKSDIDYKMLVRTKNKAVLEHAEDSIFIWRLLMALFGEDCSNKSGFHLDDKDKVVGNEQAEVSGIYTIDEFLHYIHKPDVLA